MVENAIAIINYLDIFNKSHQAIHFQVFWNILKVDKLIVRITGRPLARFDPILIHINAIILIRNF